MRDVAHVSVSFRNHQIHASLIEFFVLVIFSLISRSLLPQNRPNPLIEWYTDLYGPRLTPASCAAGLRSVKINSGTAGLRFSISLSVYLSLRISLSLSLPHRRRFGARIGGLHVIELRQRLQNYGNAGSCSLQTRWSGKASCFLLPPVIEFTF